MSVAKENKDQQLEKNQLSVEEARSLLGKMAKNMTNQEVERLIANTKNLIKMQIAIMRKTSKKTILEKLNEEHSSFASSLYGQTKYSR